jgi:hypothetical protein
MNFTRNTTLALATLTLVTASAWTTSAHACGGYGGYRSSYFAPSYGYRTSYFTPSYGHYGFSNRFITPSLTPSPITPSPSTITPAPGVAPAIPSNPGALVNPNNGALQAQPPLGGAAPAPAPAPAAAPGPGPSGSTAATSPAPVNSGAIADFRAP